MSQTIREWSQACSVYSDTKELAIDIETSSLNPWKGQIGVISLSDGHQHAVLHVRGHIPDQVKDLIRTRKTLIAHNAVTFDGAWMAAHGVDVFSPAWHDTMVGEAIATKVDSPQVSKSLDATIKRQVSRSKGKVAKEDHTVWMGPELDAQSVEYCVGDVKFLHQIVASQYQKCDQNQRREMELGQAIVPVVMRMQATGIPVNPDALRTVREDARAEAEKMVRQLPAPFQVINMQSPVQVKAAFRECGVTLLSTEEPILQTMLHKGENVDILTPFIAYRHAAQLVKMYSEKWESDFVIHHEDGQPRVHGRFNPYGARTGRFTATEPNLQQIPKKARWMFQAADPELWIVSADYSQIEVRLAAAFAQDDVLIQAIASEDVHSAVASQIFGVPVDGVTKEQRSIAKDLSFCLLYGGGAPLLYSYSFQHGGTITFEQAQELFDRWFQTYQGLARMREQAYAKARMNQYMPIYMPSGLIRWLRRGQYQNGKYVGGDLTPQIILNSVVQGAAASGLKYALRECRTRGIDTQLCGTVHDEIVATVRGTEADAQAYAAELCDAMVAGMAEITDVTIKVEPRVAHSWGDRK